MDCNKEVESKAAWWCHGDAYCGECYHSYLDGSGGDREGCVEVCQVDATLGGGIDRDPGCRGKCRDGSQVTCSRPNPQSGQARRVNDVNKNYEENELCEICGDPANEKCKYCPAGICNWCANRDGEAVCEECKIVNANLEHGAADDSEAGMVSRRRCEEKALRCLARLEYHNLKPTTDDLEKDGRAGTTANESWPAAV